MTAQQRGMQMQGEEQKQRERGGGGAGEKELEAPRQPLAVSVAMRSGLTLEFSD